MLTKIRQRLWSSPAGASYESIPQLSSGEIDELTAVVATITEHVKTWNAQTARINNLPNLASKQQTIEKPFVTAFKKDQAPEKAKLGQKALDILAKMIKGKTITPAETKILMSYKEKDTSVAKALERALGIDNSLDHKSTSPR